MRRARAADTSTCRVTGRAARAARFTPGVEVRALPVVVEDAQDLGRPAVRLDGVRDHGGELGGLARFDPDGALAEDQRDGPRQDREPVLARMHSQLIGPGAPGLVGDPHLGDGGTGRSGASVQHPGGQPALLVALRPDHDILVVGALHQLVERDSQGAGQSRELVEADAPVAGLDAAQGGGAQEGALREVVERPAAGLPQAPDPHAHRAVQIAFLRHTQEHKRHAQGGVMVGI